MHRYIVDPQQAYDWSENVPIRQGLFKQGLRYGRATGRNIRHLHIEPRARLLPRLPYVCYNATVLAYGQTGSGKTHTMGTGSTIGLSFE